MAINIHFQRANRKAQFFSGTAKSVARFRANRGAIPTSEEAIKHAGLDYEVRKIPYCLPKGSGMYQKLLTA